MYKIVSVIKQADNGEKIKFYGIKSQNCYYPDLSTDMKKVKTLCKLCNKYKINRQQIGYVIQDFI